MVDNVQGNEPAKSPSAALLQRYLTADRTSAGKLCLLDDVRTAEVHENINILLSKVSLRDGEKRTQSTSRRVKHLNDLAKVIRHVGPSSSQIVLNARRIIENVRLALFSTVKEVRAGSMRVLRYLLSSSLIFEIMLHFKIDFLVARSLDASPQKDIERLQAMRFVRQVLMVCPQSLPRSLIAPLVSIINSDIEPVDNLTWASLATLAEIALCNIQLASECGAVKVLVRGLLKCQMPDICETVVLTLCHLLNHPDTRKYVRSDLDIEGILAPMTDLHFNFHTGEESDAKLDREKRINSAKMSVMALLKSWPGFLWLLNPLSNGITSIVNMLPLADSCIQKETLEVLYNVFHLKVPEWTEDYRVAIASVDPTQYCQEWSLENGWVAAEGHSLLPPKLMERVNLMDCYHALLLASLIKSGFFHFLVDMVKRSDQFISVMAAVLIGELLHMANSILPPEYFSSSLTLPDLVASAMLPHEQSERNRASEVINCLDRIHQVKKQSLKPSSLYLKLTLEQMGYFSGKSSSRDLMQSVHISNEMDELTLQGHIRNTLVLTSPREYVTWKWDLILSLLHHPYLYTLPLTEDSLQTKFIRALTHFFKPSSRQFSSIVYSLAHSKKYSSVGLQLIRYLSKMEGGGGAGLLNSLVEDIVDQLGQVTVSKVTADVFSSSSVSNKMARDYFLYLGAVSFHNCSLLQNSKAYGPLLDICSITSRHDLHKLIISSLDFAHDNHSRVILHKLLTGGDNVTRLYATRHMRVFLRVNAPFFINWGMEMLIGQLYDLEQEVIEEAIDILDEACEEESFLEALVLQHPALLHISEKGVSLLTRFISVKRGYSLLSRLGHLTTELNAWFQDYNYRYVSVVEQRLAETFTSYRQTKEGEYHRRRGEGDNPSAIKAFVPVHFYGQLVKHEEGCGLLRDEGHIKKLLQLLKQEPNTSTDILQIKAAVWALGHIGTSQSGVELLVEDNVIQELVDMIEISPVASIRGSCFYSLCLISKTPLGTENLLSVGWVSVRHTNDEKWPLILSETIENITTPSSPISPVGTIIGAEFSGEQKRSMMSQQRSPSLPKLHVNEGRGGSFVKKTTRSISTAYTSPSKSNYVLRPVRPMTLGENDKDNPSYPQSSPIRVTRGSIGGRLSSVSSIRSVSSGVFVGVALPLELNSIYEFDDSIYNGSRASTVPTELFDDEHRFLLLETHSHTADMGMGPNTDSNTDQSTSTGTGAVTSSNTTSTSSVSDVSSPPVHDEEKKKEKILAGSVQSHSSITSNTSGSTAPFDENSYEGQLLLHREFLEVVYYLCSDVSLRKNTLHLNILCNKFPFLSQDISLYWKTMTLLSLYNYTLVNRRFIQSKFDTLTFEEIFTYTRQYYHTRELLRADHTPSTDHTSFSRRRNSTGELITRTKQDSSQAGSISKSEERLDTQSMRSIATTASELDTLSEGSLTSNEALEWEGPLTKDPEYSETNMPRPPLSCLAEAGNRLSQLELDSGRTSMPASIVEVVIDL